MTDREKLVKTAESYVGKNGKYVCIEKLQIGMIVDWCAFAVSSIMRDCGFIGKYQYNIYGGAGDIPRYSDGKYGTWFKRGLRTPQKGDLFFMRYADYPMQDKYFCDHVGIVKGVNGNTVVTLEGNVDGHSGNWAVTSTFKQKNRQLSTIYAFYRPNWQDEKTPSKPTGKTADIEYQVNALTTWQPYVKNLTDFAGIENRAVYALRIKKSTIGDIIYRVHVIGKGWLPWVKNDTDYAGRTYKDIPIDGVQIYTNNKNYTVKYRVSPRGRKYYDWVTGYSDDPETGYAGEFGKPIDKIQMYIIKK